MYSLAIQVFTVLGRSFNRQCIVDREGSMVAWKLCSVILERCVALHWFMYPVSEWSYQWSPLASHGAPGPTPTSYCCCSFTPILRRMQIIREYFASPHPVVIAVCRFDSRHSGPARIFYVVHYKTLCKYFRNAKFLSIKHFIINLNGGKLCYAYKIKCY